MERSHVLLEAAVQLLCISRNPCAPFISESWAMFGPMVEDVSYVAEGRKEESNSRKGREERERESLNSLGTLSIIRIKSGRYAFLKKLFAKNFKEENFKESK